MPRYERILQRSQLTQKENNLYNIVSDILSHLAVKFQREIFPGNHLYIKQMLRGDVSEADNKTVIFQFFFIFGIKSTNLNYIIVYTLIVEKDFLICKSN